MARVWSDESKLSRWLEVELAALDGWAAVGAVTSGMSAKDAIRTKAAAATIERRWGPYRRAKSAVYRSRALISADLTKGLE